jgi:hypothetical protein
MDDIRCNDEVVAACIEALRDWVAFNIQDFEFQTGILGESLFCSGEEAG